MNKICVYTCITGEYDNLKNIPSRYVDKDIDYICFTNNKNIKSDFWKVVYIENEGISNIKLARKIKTIGHEELNRYNLLVWMDGNVVVRKKISQYIKDYNCLKFDLTMIKHPTRDCIYDEMVACIDLHKELIANCNKLKQFYLKEKFPKHSNLASTNFYIKKNNDRVKKIMSMWFDMILKYSHRDQLSFNYVIWKNHDIEIQYTDINWDNNIYFYNERHTNIYKNYVIKCITENITIDNYIEGKYKTIDDHILIDYQVYGDCKNIELHLPDDVYTKIKKVKLSGNASFEIYNSLYVKGCWIFIGGGDPVVNIIGNFKKNTIIHIDIIKDDNVDNKNIKEVFLYFNDIEKCVECYKQLKKDYDSIINSKRWKTMNRIIKQFRR